MDPWVTTQIRLAERQGLLTGLGLSPVQVKAVYLNEMLDIARRAKEDDRSVRRALVGTGQYDYTALFPEYAPRDTEVDMNRDPDADLDSSDGTIYLLPGRDDPGFDPDEAQQMINDLIAQSQEGSVSAAELDEP